MSETIPARLWRHPTAAAIQSLADRFDLPNDAKMQDWEIEVADPARLDEFLSAYFDGSLDEDERFTLMWTIIASFDNLGHEPATDPRWTAIADALDREIELHAYTVSYWAALDSTHEDEMFRMTPLVRPVWEKHRIFLADD